jgi:hypothetical protein
MNRIARRCIARAIVSLLSCTSLADAQQGPEALQQKIQQMQQATYRNEQQLHTYQWIETVTTTSNGKTGPPRRSICRYAPDGTLYKTPLQPQEQPKLSGGPLRRKIEEKKIEEAQQEATQVHALTGLYLPLNQTKLKQAFHANRVDLEQSATDGSAIIVHDYAKLGDQMRFSLDLATMQIRGITVKSYFDDPKDALTVHVEFSLLPDGTAYPSVTTINAPSKKLSVTTVSSEFSRVAN